jgi:hypothetical protein
MVPDLTGVATGTEIEMACGRQFSGFALSHLVLAPGFAGSTMPVGGGGRENQGPC